MTPADFPSAIKHAPIFTINGRLYERCPAAAAMLNPRAIRAKINRRDGEAVVAWFVEIDTAQPEDDTPAT